MTRKAIVCKGPKNDILSDIDWDFTDANTQQHIHSLHPYPARFIPQIPALCIEKWSKPKDVVLDPFCGCGTTLVEAHVRGRNCIGIDNNAVAILLSKAKTINYSSQDLVQISQFLNQVQENRLKQKEQLVTLNYKNIGYWFSDNAISELAEIREAIDKNKEPVRTFLMAIFSSIIVRISYQDSDTRYSRIPRNYEPSEAYNIFSRKLKDAVKNLEEYIALKPTGNVQVFQADTRSLSMIESNSVDLIVTSPPYLNAYDYHKYHRHRIHWIDGDVEFARDKEIGKHDEFTRPNATPDKYFEDMGKCFSEWERVLKPGSKAVIVIGDAIVNKTPVIVGTRFVEMMKNLDFNFDGRWIRNLNVNRKSFNQKARINQEHIIMFSKRD